MRIADRTTGPVGIVAAIAQDEPGVVGQSLAVLVISGLLAGYVRLRRAMSIDAAETLRGP